VNEAAQAGVASDTPRVNSAPISLIRGVKVFLTICIVLVSIFSFIWLLPLSMVRQAAADCRE
jgi:hypothetical protein